jgi:TPR repeat protein
MDAQNHLGWCFLKGLKTLYKDPKEAFYWFDKSARQGFPRAQCNLGVCYDLGYGVKQDFDESIFW